MKFKGEDRRFDAGEARQVRSLMDVISIYAIESTVWWDQSKGETPEGQPGLKDDDRKGPREPVKAAPTTLRGPVASARPLAKPNGTPWACQGR
jgi:hypothetical protein